MNVLPVILPWEREETDTPIAAKAMRDYLEKEERRADDLERDVYEPMQRLERAMLKALALAEERLEHPAIALLRELNDALLPIPDALQARVDALLDRAEEK